MSERDSKWWIIVTFLIATFALTGIFHYRAQLRDLQRRVGQLEQQVKR